MMTQPLYILPMFLLILILAIGGTCSAFPTKPKMVEGLEVDVPLTAVLPGYSFVLRGATSQRTSLALSSKQSPDFSPDTNPKRQSYKHPNIWQHHQHHHSLRNSIFVEYDKRDECRSGPMTRAMNTVQATVSDRLAVLNNPSLNKNKRGRSIFSLRRLWSPGVRSKSKSVSSAMAFTGGAIPRFGAKEKSLGRKDFALFLVYFCNICVVMLTVVTVPAIAREHGLESKTSAAFCASMAGVATMGGFVGKLVNGFVCQRLGGHRSSYVYLTGLSLMSLGMSFSRSLVSTGMYLFGLDFLSSIQWVAISSVLLQRYQKVPRLQTLGITHLSIASTVGALSAKTFGSALLKATQWRTTSRIGALTALVGALTMYFEGGGALTSQSIFRGSSSDASGVEAATRVSAGGQQVQSPLTSLKTVLGSPIFWMVGVGHSLGHLARVSDRLLGPFLQDVGGISGPMAIGLTSSVTLGFMLGLFRVKSFRKMKSVKEKMNLIRNSYIVSILSTIGLAVCGVDTVSKFVGGGATTIMAVITILSGIIASSVSFQFYQIPAVVSSTMFPESTSVALSLTDAIAFFVTSLIMGLNSLVLGNFGWSASWSFMAVIFTLGGMSMTRALRPVFVESMKAKQ